MRFANIVCLLVAVLVASPVAATGCSSKSASSSKKNKGSSSKGTAAKTSGQKSGGTATADKGQAQAQGADYEGVTCAADTDGLAWCDSDTAIVFCSDGQFYTLDCTSVGADVCGEDPDTKSVDCYATGDVG